MKGKHHHLICDVIKTHGSCAQSSIFIDVSIIHLFPTWLWKPSTFANKTGALESFDRPVKMCLQEYSFKEFMMYRDWWALRRRSIHYADDEHVLFSNQVYQK